ncbi:uncharacterized protein [Cicer arietinum]
MGFRLNVIRQASLTSIQAASKSAKVPKGYVAVYVGEKHKRFVIPISYLNQPSFQDLLSQAEEEFGYDHPMGGLTIPCTEDVFQRITSRLTYFDAACLAVTDALRIACKRKPIFVIVLKSNLISVHDLIGVLNDFVNMLRHVLFIIYDNVDVKLSFLLIPISYFPTYTRMGFRLPSMIRRASSSKGLDVPKGYLAVYIGEEMKRFVIPISYLNQPLFQELLSQVEEQFGYDHPMGGLTIPCREDVFLDITSRLN